MSDEKEQEVADRKGTQLTREETLAILGLLVEVYPLALERLQAPGVAIDKQWAFWLKFETLDMLWDGDLVEGFDCEHGPAWKISERESQIRFIDDPD